MSSRVRALKPLILAAGLAGLLPALGSAQAPTIHRKAGMWESSMTLGGRPAMTSGMCIDESVEKRAPIVSPQQMGGQACPSMTTQPISGGFRMEGTCSNGGRTTHITATVKGDFNSAYAMDMAFEVDGKPQRSVHMDVKWTGPCGAGVKPGDMVMVMPDGKRMVVNPNAPISRPAPGAR